MHLNTTRESDRTDEDPDLDPRAAQSAVPVKVLMIYPKFLANSFWSLTETCRLAGAKYPAPPLGLVTVAALLPAHWSVRLIDRNVEDLADEDILAADVVMTGAMLPQRPDALKLIAQVKALGRPVVIGGPDVTSSPAAYASADFRVLGEAEGVLDRFVEAFENGVRAGEFEAPKFQVDVTKTPIPRYDLLNLSNYMYVNVQFSRGCPFMCEFCDIIELFGRKPRTKTAEQVLRELDALYQLGYRGHVDFVDDNLIGNKKAVKAFLPLLAEWQRERKFPFEFSTEASLNLADDDALLQMMADAEFFVVFIGIESPDEDVLIATKKKQNTRRDIAQSVHRIYAAGIQVIAGFIVGFDEEHGSVAEPITKLIEESGIPCAMVGLMYALPSTQLTQRLEREGRLHPLPENVDDYVGTADQCTEGLNFETQRPRRDILLDYREIVTRVYAPDSFHGRVRRTAMMMQHIGGDDRVLTPSLLRDVPPLLRTIWTLGIRAASGKRLFWGTLGMIGRRNPRALKHVVEALAMYAHLGPFSLEVAAAIDRKIAALDADEAAALAGPAPDDHAGIREHRPAVETVLLPAV